MMPTAARPARPKRLAALLSALAIAVALSGCTSSSTDPAGATSSRVPATSSMADSLDSTAAAANHNAADIAFAADMIPHHQQALTLSELVPDRTDNPQVIVLAAKIKTAQQPEIEELQALLAQWGASAAESDRTAADRAAADHIDMAGMVDKDTMTRLESLRGDEFDTLWLESMISHHEGAEEMANTEIADGENSAAKMLAASIITAQKVEIDQMTKLLAA